MEREERGGESLLPFLRFKLCIVRSLRLVRASVVVLVLNIDAKFLHWYVSATMFQVLPHKSSWFGLPCQRICIRLVRPCEKPTC
jgi:hypothetical protein